MNLSADVFSTWGRAFHLLSWHRQTQFCAGCAHPLQDDAKETARYCSRCKTLYYPTVSPCIIVLVHRDRELLLARSPRFPRSTYSTLAGYIEPGESAEEALHREIYEEVGILVKPPRYFDSQPWPFPSQLMLGFFAEYDSGEIRIDNNEICDAQWYPPDNLPEIPGEQTIAGTLIRTFIEEHQ